MTKRIVSLLLTGSLLFSMLPFNALTALAASGVVYGDADGSGKVELADVNLMERYIAGEEQAVEEIHFTEADVNADGVVDEVDVDMVKEYLVGNLDSLTPQLYTITFNTDGGGEMEPIQAGAGYPYRGKIDSPDKYDYIFVRWVKEDGTTYYQHEDIITSDMTLTAVYEKMDLQGQLHIDSFSLDDQQPDLSFALTGDFASADEVKANLTFATMDGSDPVELAVRDDGDGNFTVYAPEGFTPGATYQLTLGEGLYFAGKEQMLRTANFTIYKDEVDNLQYNSDLIFIQDTDQMNYTVDGETVPVLESALLSNEETEQVAGSFTMPQGGLEVGDVVCIYQNTHPADRDYTQNTYEDDALAYIRITGVENGGYLFESLNEEDAEEVLAMPDTIPYQVQQLPTADGTVEKKDYDTYARSMLGQEEAPAFAVNDFLVFYTENFENLTEDSPSVYGQITAVNETTVSYKIVSREDIESYMSLFVTQEADNQEILDSIDMDQLLEDVRKQAEESGFAEQAANQMLLTALEGEDLRQRLLDDGFTEEEIEALANSPEPLAVGALGGRTKIRMEDINVTPQPILGGNFKNGVGMSLDMGVVFSLEKKMPNNQVTEVKIELSAYFEQEVALDVRVGVEDKWKWYLFIPVLQELNVNASIDIQNYTAVSVGAKVYTLRDEISKKKWTAISETITGPNASPAVRNTVREINSLAVKAKKMKARLEDKWETVEETIDTLKSTLPPVEVDGVTYSLEQIEEDLQAEDVAGAFDETFNAETGIEAKTGMEQLMQRYQDMLSQECDWVDLVTFNFFEKEFHISVVAIKVDVDGVIRANVNLALGADMEYQVGKRYSFWIHVLQGTSGSSETDLINERFGFQFYIMGTLGLRAGIKVDIAVGLLSTSIFSIGGNVEFGVYLKLCGYFLYYFSLERPLNDANWVREEEAMGAMYLEVGIYVTVKFKAQMLASLIKYEPTLYDGEFPLFSSGDQVSVYDFALQPDEDDVLYIQDEDANSLNGITMPLPAIYRTMKTMNLVSGDIAQQEYPGGKFVLEFSDSRFTCDNNGTIHVNVPDGTRYMACDMRVVWKSNKMAFSKFDIDITIPVVWTNLSESEMNEKFTASVALGNAADGYTTVWSQRYGRVDTFDLPSQEEILALVNYDSYNTDSGNLKYESVGGYQEQSTDLNLVTDRSWLFDITPKTYTLTVEGVQNADGSTGTRTYQAQFGESFDLSELAATGAANPAAGLYTVFHNLTDASGNVMGQSVTVDMAFAETYGDNCVVQANYLDSSLTATFEFVGLGNSVPPLEVKFQQGTAPSAAQVPEYAAQYGGPQTSIREITPVIAPSNSSMTYTVVCEVDETRLPYTITYDAQNGQQLESKRYLEGDRIYPPYEPTYTGYIFQGWYADPDGVTPFDFDAPMPAADITVYAKWEARTYTVSFDMGSDDVSQVGPIQVQYGKPYGTLPQPDARQGWKFVGWFTAKTGGTQVTADTLHQSQGNVTLYGRWEQKKEVDPAWLQYETVTTVDYDENAHGFVFSVAAPDQDLEAADFEVLYSKEQASPSWSSDAPVNAGTYLVKIKLNETDDYLPFEMATQPKIRINKASMRPGKNYLPAVKVTISNYVATVDISSCGIKGDGVITYRLMDEAAKTLDTNTTGVFDMTKWPDRAIYSIRAEIAEGTNYLATRTVATTQWMWDGEGTLAPPPSNASMAGSVAENETADQPAQEQAAASNAALPTGAAGGAGIGLNTASAISLLADANAQKTTMTLSPEELYLAQGKTFEVSFTLDRAIPVWGVLMAVGYDTDLLELAGYTVGGVFEESQFTFQEDTTAAPYKFLATRDTLDTTYAEDAVITLQFKVKDKAADRDTTISLETLEVVNRDSQVNVDKGQSLALAVDGTAPVLEGIRDGGQYYNDIVVTVVDDNLASVTVNGQEVTLVDGKFAMRPALDPQTVVATDKVGNQTTVTVMVSVGSNPLAILSPASGDSGSGLLVAVLAVSLLGAGLLMYEKKRRKARQDR